MNANTLTMVLEIIQAVEAGLPVAVELALMLKAQLANDPAVVAQLNAQATAQATQALSTIQSWRSTHQ